MIDYMLDDFPIEQDKPLWRGLYQFADQLAKMLPTFPTSSPVLLSGDWGAGKTTL
jgi:tRNA A37 threonylcarbamoyladenosine biosynthesis protein TsaE